MNEAGNELYISAEAVPTVQPDPNPFDLWAARRFIIAERALVGAFTPLGRRYSNMIEMIENYQVAGTEEQVSCLKQNLVRTVNEIAEIKGRKVIAPPVKMLEGV